MNFSETFRIVTLPGSVSIPPGRLERFTFSDATSNAGIGAAGWQNATDEIDVARATAWILILRRLRCRHALGRSDATAQPRMRAEKNRGVKQVRFQRVTEERDGRGITLEQAGWRVRVGFGMSPP